MPLCMRSCVRTCYDSLVALALALATALWLSLPSVVYNGPVVGSRRVFDVDNDGMG